MAPDDLDQRDAEIARLLRTHRVEPDDAWVKRTEVRLLGGTRRSRRRPLLAALGLSGGLAALAVLASLLGAGPLATGGSDEVRATQECREQTTTSPAAAGKLVEGADGTTTVVPDGRRSTVTTRCP